MNLDEIRDILSEIHDFIDGKIDDINELSQTTQTLIYLYIKKSLRKFETTGGKFVADQSFANMLSKMVKGIDAIINVTFNPGIPKYLQLFDEAERGVLLIHNEYNKLGITEKDLLPIKKGAIANAEYNMTSSIRSQYLQPIKFQIMRSITTGQSVDDTIKIFDKWNAGQTMKTVQPMVSFDRIIANTSSNSAYQFLRDANEQIALDMECFIYVGNVIKDSRPFCRHLVGLRKKIELDEVPKLVKQYPDGLMPDTTKENFYQRAGGYNCRHQAYPVGCENVVGSS